MGEPKDFMTSFISTHRVPEDAIQYFQSVAWTNKYLSDPLYTTIPTFSRVLKPTGEDYFFSRTVNTPATIPHWVTLSLKDFPSPPDSPRGTLKMGQGHTEAVKVPEHPECVMLLRLGENGLNGHPSTIHGGMSCAILDEMLGLCVMLHHQHISGPRDSLFTASLNVTYRAPVPTPSDIMVRCWLVGREGRKWLARGQMVNQDGVVMTEGEGLWVLTKRQEKL